MTLEEHIKKEMSDCPLSEEQEGKLLVALEKYLDEMDRDAKLLLVALTSPALEWQSDRGGRNSYPANFRGRVPLKVKVAKKVTTDLPFLHKELGVKKDTVCEKDNEYYVWVNSYGAVSAILPNGGKLGLLPSEFDVTEWHNSK